MLFAVIAFALLIITLLQCYINAYKKPTNFPPGPPRLPIYGAYYAVRAQARFLADACLQIGTKYKTQVLGLYLAQVPAVVVNDPALIKEVLCRPELDGRMDIILFRLRSFWKKLGIFFTDGYFWHVQRRFTLRYMRDFGFGRRDACLEEVVASECREMIDLAINGPKYPVEEVIVKDGLVNLQDLVTVPFINGVCHVFTRMTLPRSEYHVLYNLSAHAFMFQQNSDDFGGILSLTPTVKDIAPNWSGYNNLCKGNQSLLDFFKKMINDAMQTHDEMYDRHFLDMYIKKMREEVTKNKSTYTEQQLQLVCTDYMFPAASAQQTVMALLVERMLLQPEVQARAHAELDRVVGRHRAPTLDDRRNMPYIEACIREILRFETLVPLGVPHRAMSNTKLAGYDIPEDCMVSVNLMALHTNKQLWGDPDTFRPERFIVDGALCVARDKSLPFGAGRRLCAGETYARQTLFQVFSALMQAFHISTPDGKPLQEPSRRIQGIITTIPKYWVRLTPRI